jgi:hypothetical protein
MASSESGTRLCGVMNELSVYIHRASPHQMYILQYQGVTYEDFFLNIHSLLRLAL